MNGWNELEIKFFEDAIKARTLYIYGEINSDLAARIGKAIVWLNSIDNAKEIVSYIESSGGDVRAGLDIYDIIKHSRAPVTGIVYRMANSMAAVILQACKTRKAMPHSEILAHGINVRRPLYDLENNAKEVLKGSKYLQKRIEKIISQRTGLTLEKTRKLLREGKSLRPSEAKEIGLIDEIV